MTDDEREAMSGYTPSTGDVRRHYAYGCGPKHTWDESQADFDRWLADHDAEVRADAAAKSPTVDRAFFVTSGEYSDYRIHSIWTTREAAEAAGGEYDTVEEWIVNTTTERTITQWHAWLTTTGEIRVGERAVETNQPGTTRVTPFLRRGAFQDWEGHGFGPSPEHARKSLSDALAKAKAEQIETERGRFDAS